jgi:hypothetical protein
MSAEVPEGPKPYRVLAVNGNAAWLEAELNEYAREGYRVLPGGLSGGSAEVYALVLLEHLSVRDAVGAKMADMLEAYFGQALGIKVRAPAAVVPLRRVPAPDTPSRHVARYIETMDRLLLERWPALTDEQMSKYAEELAVLWAQMTPDEQRSAWCQHAVRDGAPIPLDLPKPPTGS